MIESDPSARRRLADLEASVADLRRQLDSRIARPPVMGFPRDRWLGVTVANGQTYPATGNTFYVKLISAAFSPETPGDSTVTQRDRGTIVLARTWPEVYLAEGAEIFVDRIKGVGEGGSWWIHANDPSGMEYARLYGGSSINDPYGSQTLTLSSATSWSTELLANGVTLDGLPFADGTPMGNVGEAIGTRLRVSKAGQYAASAQANVMVSPTLGSGGIGYRIENWVVQVNVRKNNVPESYLMGAVSGEVNGQQSHWITPQAVGGMRIDAGDIVNFWLDGTSYVAPNTWRVVNWDCLLTRLDD